MQLKTFDEILTDLCDSFDLLITPKSISRSNTNIIYLIFKAIAKGFEVINNVCVALSNKFNPASCSVEDLDSVASIVGTERYKGSGSGLHIIITNTSDEYVTLLSGMYQYNLDDDTTFVFEILEDTELSPKQFITQIAMTEKTGNYPVTAQSKIEVTGDKPISSDIVFSCADNEALLGTEPESDLDFRKRIIDGYNNQDTIVELENEIKKLPYIYDCQIRFNNTFNPVTFDGIELPPFYAVIFFAGLAKNELAEIIAGKIICPTVQTEDSLTVEYKNPVFVSGSQPYYLIPFKRLAFDVEVIYRVDNTYVNDTEAKNAIQTALAQAYVAEVHKDFVREDDIYNIIQSLNLSGISILGVNLYVDNTQVNYVDIPASRIPELGEVRFVKE